MEFLVLPENLSTGIFSFDHMAAKLLQLEYALNLDSPCPSTTTGSGGCSWKILALESTVFGGNGEDHHILVTPFANRSLWSPILPQMYVRLSTVLHFQTKGVTIFAGVAHHPIQFDVYIDRWCPLLYVSPLGPFQERHPTTAAAAAAAAAATDAHVEVSTAFGSIVLDDDDDDDDDDDEILYCRHSNRSWHSVPRKSSTIAFTVSKTNSSSLFVHVIQQW